MSVVRGEIAQLDTLELHGEALVETPPRWHDASRRRHATRRRGWRGMLGAFSARLRGAVGIGADRGIELDLTDSTLAFQGRAEFEDWLGAKTDFPVAKVADLIRRPPADLRKVSAHIRSIEKRFAEVLTQSLRESELVGELMKELEIKHFSVDHGWRDLVEALNQKDAEHDEYKRLALVKYMEYLGARQDMLRTVYLDKTRGIPSVTEAARTTEQDVRN